MNISQTLDPRIKKCPHSPLALSPAVLVSAAVSYKALEALEGLEGVLLLLLLQGITASWHKKLYENY